MSTKWPLAMILIGALALGVGCKSEPENPYPQGYPMQGYPGQPQANPGYPQQPVPPAQPAQPVQPAQPAQPAQPMDPAANPMAGLAQAMGQAMGQMTGQMGGQAQGQAATLIPWDQLSQALPTTAPGWTLDGQVEGQSAAVMGINTSEAKCTLKQGQMVANITLLDTSFNPMLAMPFTMMQSIRVDSSTEKTGPVTVAGHPGIQNFKKTANSSQVLVMVNNRIMVTVDVSNTPSEAPALQLAQSVNYSHLAALVGG